MLPKFRNVAVLARSVFLMRICCPNRRQDLLKHELAQNPSPITSERVVQAMELILARRLPKKS